MGSIEPYETAQGRRYRVRYRDPDRRSREKAGFKLRRDAENYLATITVAARRGEWVDPRSAAATVGELGDQWLSGQTHLKPSSLKPLEIAWRTHVAPTWSKRRIGDVRHSDVQAWVSELTGRRSATVVIRAHGILAGILDVAVRDRRIPFNPAREIKLPRKARREHVYLGHAEVQALAAAAGEHQTLVLVLAYCGLRWGEAVGLRVRDVNTLRRRISVSQNAVEVAGVIEVGTPKTHKRRTVPYPRLFANDLAAALQGKGPDDLVFGNEHGHHLRRARASKGSRSWFKSALAAAHLPPMTPHDLRHTAASLAVSAGANVKAVQRMLGHASAAMTLDVYADLFDDDLEAISDRLDEAYARAVVGDSWGPGVSLGPKAPEIADISGV